MKKLLSGFLIATAMTVLISACAKVREEPPASTTNLNETEQALLGKWNLIELRDSNKYYSGSTYTGYDLTIDSTFGENFYLDFNSTQSGAWSSQPNPIGKDYVDARYGTPKTDYWWYYDELHLRLNLGPYNFELPVRDDHNLVIRSTSGTGNSSIKRSTEWKFVR